MLHNMFNRTKAEINQEINYLRSKGIKKEMNN